MRFVLLIISFFGLVFIFTRKRWGGHKYFLKHFKKRREEELIAIPIEGAGSTAAHCPASMLADESIKPCLGEKDEKAMSVCFSKAENALKRNDIDDAERNYVKALAFDENHIEANLRLGFIYLKKDLPAKAEAIFKKLISLKCGDAVIYSNLGNALYQQKKFTESRDAYAKAVELDSSNPKRYLNLGRVLHEMGNFDGAVEYTNKALAFDPGNADYMAVMADIYVSLGNLERAKEYIDQAKKLDGKNVSVRAVAKKIKAKRKGRRS